MQRLGGGCEGEVYKVSDKLVKKVWRPGKTLAQVKGKYEALKKKMEKVQDPSVKLVSPKKYCVKRDGQVITYSRYIPKKPLDHEPWDVKNRWYKVEPSVRKFGITDLHTGNVIYYKNKWYIIDAFAH